MGNFFVKKVTNIRKELDDAASGACCDPAEYDFPRSVAKSFHEFTPLSDEDVIALVQRSSKKCCALDPIPTKLVSDCIDVLLPTIKHIINLSLDNAYFPHVWKEALVNPLLKRFGLDPLYKNFRPVSNLPYVSKLVERSASDLLTSLQTRFGVSGKVLEWFASYLHDRSQRITINGTLSDSFSLQCGVPQGSCLGPILFVIYASKLFEITSRHLPEVHCYADDTQLYLSFKPGLRESHVEALLHMQRCIDDLRQWMLMDRLKLNDEKTEFLLVGTRQQLAKLCVEPLAVGDHLINPCHEAKNLGCWFDQQLSMVTNINKICSVSYFYLHNIRRIRKFLSVESTKLLVHALVTSRIDYCNSLLYGLPQTQLSKLQRVQNTAARLICNVSRFEPISIVLFELHWLPVHYRIIFKVLVITYKAINGMAPKYISDLIIIKAESSYSLRSNSELLLAHPRVRTKTTLGDRAFCAAAPKLWNSLPQSLRKVTSVDSFKVHLKTLLFRQAYKDFV